MCQIWHYVRPSTSIIPLGIVNMEIISIIIKFYYWIGKKAICNGHRKPGVTSESRQWSLQALANIKTTAFPRKAKIVVEIGNLQSVCPKGFHTVSLNSLAFYNSLEFLTFISYFYSQKNFKCNSTSTISPSGRKCTSTKETQTTS